MLRRPKQAVIKKQKGRTNYNVKSTQNLIMNPSYGLLQNTGFRVAIMANEPGELTAAHIYAMEFILKKELKKSTPLKLLKTNKYLLRLFPHRPRSKKPNETGLGRGKGPIHS